MRNSNMGSLAWLYELQERSEDTHVSKGNAKHQYKLTDSHLTSLASIPVRNPVF